MRTNRLLLIGAAAFATACGTSQTPAGTPAPAAPAAPAQLGGPPSSAGTTTADTGEIKPANPAKFYKKPGYSPYAGRNYPERPYLGDEHVHTAWSVDAGGSGATLGPEEATRFARGEEVTSTSGQPVRLGQPLDWVAITDHSDMMGMITEIKGGNPEMMADPTLKRWRDMFAGGPVEAKKGVMELGRAGDPEAAGGRRRIQSLPRASGRKPPRSRRSTTNRDASRRSSATSGRRTPAAATTCTGTSSTATTRTRPTRCCRTPRSRARTPRTSGNG